MLVEFDCPRCGCGTTQKIDFPKADIAIARNFLDLLGR